MADLDNLEYYIKFPSPNFNYATAAATNGGGGNGSNNGENDFVFIVDEQKLPVILLFGWAGCRDKYLAKYSQIYEEKGLITLRYTAPVKCLFLKRYQMISIGERLVKLLIDLNFDTHPIIIHIFSNGGAFLYQNFALAMDKSDRNIMVKGVIFDSAPGKRRVSSLFRAISAILGGNVFYNYTVSLIMTMFLSMIWFYEVISNTIHPKTTFQSNPLENLKNEKNRCPQLFIYSKNDDLIPHTDIEYFADWRRKLGVDVTTVCYDRSLHVKHLAENRENYVKTVYNFINRCLNGST
nr:unnamed protein product [Callosobruchus analis]